MPCPPGRLRDLRQLRRLSCKSLLRVLRVLRVSIFDGTAPAKSDGRAEPKRRSSCFSSCPSCFRLLLAWLAPPPHACAKPSTRAAQRRGEGEVGEAAADRGFDAGGVEAVAREQF